MLKKIQNSIMLKPVAFLLASSFFFLSFKNIDGKVVLRAGTPVLLETNQTIVSDNLSVGQSIDFKVRFDVKTDNKLVVRAGSIAKGQVTRVSKSKGLGKEGYVEIQLKTVQTIDGQMVPLTSGNLYREGEDKQGLAWGLGILVCILFLTIKGKEAMIPSGTTVDSNIAMDVEIAVQ